MTFPTLPSKGDKNWNVPLNQALTDLNTRVIGLEDTPSAGLPGISAKVWGYPTENGMRIAPTSYLESIAVSSGTSAALRYHVRDAGTSVISWNLTTLATAPTVADGDTNVIVTYTFAEVDGDLPTGINWVVNGAVNEDYNGQYVAVDFTRTTLSLLYPTRPGAWVSGAASLIPPSVYNQVEAKIDGVWIKNADWTDENGYSYNWKFGTDGSFTIPNGSPINFGYGNARITSGMGFHIQSEEGVLIEAIDTSNDNAIRMWQFDTDGSLELPNGGTAMIKTANNYPTLLAYSSSSDIGHGGPELDWMNGPLQNFVNGETTRNTLYINGFGLYVGMNENEVEGFPAPNFQFTPDGTWQFPILPANQRTGTGNNLRLGPSDVQQILSTSDGTVDFPSAQRLVVSGGDGFGDDGEGGDIYLWAGRSDGANGTGGDIKVDAGNAAGAGEGGTVKVRAGLSGNGTGGFVDVTAGYGGTAGGDVRISGGTSNVLGGSVFVTATNGGSITLEGSAGVYLGSVDPLNQVVIADTASSAPFTPAVDLDWDTAPTTLGAALNELAARLRAIENL